MEVVTNSTFDPTYENDRDLETIVECSNKQFSEFGGATSMPMKRLCGNIRGYCSDTLCIGFPISVPRRTLFS